MLQQSEYRAGDFLHWFWRTKNFKQVAKVRKLKLTAAARGFKLFLWVEVALAWLVLAIYLYFSYAKGQFVLFIVFAIVLFLVAPYVMAYSLALASVVARVVILAPQEKMRDAHTQKLLADHPAFKIAISGSYGKTSMKEMLATVLSQGKTVMATPGNMNTPAGISRFAADLKGDEEVLIFELGEYYPGDITKLSQLVCPDMGIITGINEAHLSKFRSLEATANTIYELGDWLASNRKDQVLNRDDPNIKDQDLVFKNRLYFNGESPLAAKRAGNYNATAYNQKGAGEWRAEGAKTSLEGTSFKLKKGAIVLKVHSKLLGLHQIGPLSAVAAIAHEFGLSNSKIEQGLAFTRPFEHRMEPKTDSGGVITIDDAYNGNPDGARVAIEFLAVLTGHKRYYVTPGITETAHRTKEVHETIGRLLAEAGIEVVVLIETSVKNHIVSGLTQANFKGQLLTYPDEISALLALPKLTKAGDVVLLQNDWPDAFA